MSRVGRINWDEDEDTQAVPSRPSSANGGLLQVVWRRRWWVLLSTVICVAISFAYLSKQTPIYSSSTRIYVQEISPRIMGTGQDGIIPSSLSTQCELIKSTPLLSLAVDMPEVKALKTIQATDNPIGQIQSGLTTTIGPTGDVMIISYESPSAVDAAQVVNSVAEAYADYQAKQQHSTAAEMLRSLQKEKDKRDAELKQELQATLDFKRANGMLSFQDEKGNIILQRLAMLSENLTAANLETIDSKAKADGVQSVKDDPEKLLELARYDHPKNESVNIDHQDDSALSADALDAAGETYQAAVDEAAHKLYLLKLTKTDSHPEVIEAESDLAWLKDQAKEKEQRLLQRRNTIVERQAALEQSHKSVNSSETSEEDKKLAADYVLDVSHQLTMAQQRESELQSEFDEQKKLAFDLNAKSAEYNALDTELQRTEKLCDLLDDKIKEINVSEDTGLINVSVLDVARPEQTPIRPDRPRMLGMGLILGLMLGIGLAMGLDFVDHRIRSAEEVAELLDAPVLGLVPHISDAATIMLRGKKVALDPTSDVSETYRTIRTAIYFGAHKLAAKKLLVTSPAPGDGKSTSASNLAIAMAQAGHKILLLDADFRRPTQHKIFELPDKIGIINYLSGESTLEEAIHPSGIEKLDILGCGAHPTNPSEILNSQRFADLLNELAARYDEVIIDSPPVAPVTDARILGALCDMTILVLRAEKSARRPTEYARDSLRGVGAKIMGVIVNDVPRRRDRYGYYYSYGYGYRYYQYGYGSDHSKNNGNGTGHRSGTSISVGNGHSNGNGIGNGNGSGSVQIDENGNGKEIHVAEPTEDRLA